MFPVSKMQSFSARQRLHCFPPLLYAFARFKIDHLIVYFVFASFNSLMYLESTVLNAYFLLLNDCWWLRNLVLNSPSVMPIYVFGSWFSENTGLSIRGFVSSTHHQAGSLVSLGNCSFFLRLPCFSGLLNYAFHILHTAVADLDRPSTEYPAQWVVNWKMLIDQT